MLCLGDYACHLLYMAIVSLQEINFKGGYRLYFSCSLASKPYMLNNYSPYNYALMQTWILVLSATINEYCAMQFLPLDPKMNIGRIIPITNEFVLWDLPPLSQRRRIIDESWVQKYNWIASEFYRENNMGPKQTHLHWFDWSNPLLLNTPI